MKRGGLKRKLCVCGGVFFMLAISAGCARLAVVKQQPPLDYGQFLLREVPPEIDISALKGKRIVIDPGHGGSFAGAVGPNNLREADVNLGVGLHLWGMLTQAGADAHLTRMDDSNVYQGDGFDLKKDLQARADLAMAHDADLFVSLHHNADVLPGKKKNALETYFKMSDFGPSLDVAQHIHRQLALSLGQPDNSVLPGNYHVLREFPGPAVLGEPSYISHADNSFKLGLAPMQRIEAQAYFLGIAEYFSKGVPKVTDVQPTGTVDDALPLITATVSADRDVPIDPDSIEMRLDDSPVEAVFDLGSLVSYLPRKRLANGNHLVEISLRNMNGNAAKLERAEFVVAMPPAYVLLTSNFQEVQPDSVQPLRLTAKVLDRDVMPVADGTSVEFRVSEGTLSSPTATTVGGEAVTYFTPAGDERMRIASASAHVGHLTHKINMYVRDDAAEIFSLSVVDGATGVPIEHAVIKMGDRPIGYSDRSGYFASQADFTGGFLVVSARGYIPQFLETSDISASQTIQLHPIANGLLFGKRIAIDPQAGGEEKGETGPTGVRASDVNLQVARYLASFLKAAGAETVLTREADLTTTPLRRVEAAEQFGAHLFISIGHGGFLRRTVTGEPYADELQSASDSRVMYYPTSKEGRRLAEEIAGSLRDGGIAQETAAHPASDFVLTHTSSPAVVVSMPGPALPAAEEHLREVEVVKREAYAVYCAVLEYMGFDREADRLQVP